MKKFEFETESCYSIWVEAETEEKANEIFNNLFKENAIIIN